MPMLLDYPEVQIFLQNANIFIHSTVSGIYKYKYANSTGLFGSLISSFDFSIHSMVSGAFFRLLFHH